MAAVISLCGSPSTTVPFSCCQSQSFSNAVNLYPRPNGSLVALVKIEGKADGGRHSIVIGVAHVVQWTHSVNELKVKKTSTPFFLFFSGMCGPQFQRVFSVEPGGLSQPA